MKKVTKNIPLYSGKIIIFQIENDECLNDIADKYNLNYDVKDFDAITFKYKNNYCLAFSETIKPCIIAHESFHAVSYIFDDHFIDMDCKNDEPAAYLLKWIVNECHKFLKI